jgi:hypothetical protein
MIAIFFVHLRTADAMANGRALRTFQLRWEADVDTGCTKLTKFRVVNLGHRA